MWGCGGDLLCRWFVEGLGVGAVGAGRVVTGEGPGLLGEVVVEICFIDML